MAPVEPKALRILHCLRAPVGGLFRHVLDLARQQAQLGHHVGIIADNSVSDALTDAKFDAIRPVLDFGLTLHPMSRRPGFGDVGAARVVSALARQHNIDVLHGHGAKGGAYARLAARWLKLQRFPIAALYTPHGGTLNFDPATTEGKIYIGLEKILARFTDGLIFESDYARRRYIERIATGRTALRVIPNGLAPDDFKPHNPNNDASDFLFVGELRHLKGVDVLLKALAELNSSRDVTATIVGQGPDAESFKTLASDLGLTGQTRFPGAMPARDAFCLGRCLVVPSRKESFPYIVLEAGAAAMALIATEVGGIPEIAQGTDLALIAPDNVAALTDAMSAFLDGPDLHERRAASLLAKVRETYTVSAMTGDVIGFYRHVMEAPPR